LAGDERKGREVPLEEEANEIQDASPLPPVILSRKATIEAVRTAIAELDTDFREAIVLRELEGLSYKEISEVTDVPIGTVMSRLSRGRDQLALLLSDRKKNDQL
jgi:RNA polymerase sigma-70 factor (ECF subfamily)